MNKVKHKQSTPYDRQANGQVEVTNGELEIILTKTIYFQQNDLDNRLHDAA